MLLLLITSILFILKQPLLVDSYGKELLSADELPACNLEFKSDQLIDKINNKICEIVKYNLDSKHLNEDGKLIKMKHLIGQFLCENKNTGEKIKIREDIRMELKGYLHSNAFKIQSKIALENFKKKEEHLKMMNLSENKRENVQKMLDEEKKWMEKIECHLSDNGDELWLKSLLKNVLKGKNGDEKEFSTHPLFIITTKIWEKFFDSKNGLAFKIVDIADEEKHLPFDPLAHSHSRHKHRRVKRQQEMGLLTGICILLLLFFGPAIFAAIATLFAPVLYLLAFILVAYAIVEALGRP